MQLRIVGPTDVDVHANWCQLIRAVFTRADFQRWIEWGCWNADYQAYALFDGDTPVANVSRTRTRLLLDGQECRGWQLGAVCCLPAYRGGGRAKRLMQAVLADCNDDPVLLFANPNVLDFYPRFGFRPREEWIFGVEHVAVPAASRAPALDPADPAMRALILRLAADGRACSERFGARGHGEIILWYLANGFTAAPLQPLPDVLVFCQQADDSLTIDEVLCANEIDLPTLLPQLIEAPIRRVRFGFTPDRWWPQARPVGIDADADLFVRGFDPAGAHRFPLLART
jgi:GNAT superfamily N-acetyltransferase